jgi:glycine C-acetyltransferase
MDIFERIAQNRGPLGTHEDSEGYFIFPKIEGELSNRMHFQGREVIVWSINNYLGLGNHPEVRKADTLATEKYGLAYPMGSRMMSGDTDLHYTLEKELAEFEQMEAAVLVNFGYMGIMSAIDCLLSRRDVVVYDRGCHACIVDGVRMHSGNRFVFQHNDMESLDKQLQAATKVAEENGGGILVISEGVFGMRGDQGKLKEIVAMKSKYNFRLMVDDAHGFGTLGATGMGAGEEQGVQDEIDVYFATFAKSMGAVGAFLAGSKNVVQYMKYNMRSQIFAKSLMSPLVEGNLVRLRMLRSMPELKNKLWENVNMLQSGLKEAGFDIGVTNSCVTPVMMKGSVEEAKKLVYDLRENHGIFCSIVVYPVIPKGMILLRLIPTAVHTAEDIKETITAFTAIKEKLESNYYKESAVAE